MTHKHEVHDKGCRVRVTPHSECRRCASWEIYRDTRFVEVTRELLDALGSDWSRPVQIRIRGENGSLLEMEFRDSPAVSPPFLTQEPAK